MNVLALICLVPLPLSPQTVEKISGPMPRDPNAIGGSVLRYEFSTQELGLFLTGDLETVDQGGLWSVPFTGGALRRLATFTRFEPEPDLEVHPVPGSQRAVFWADLERANVHELFVVPADGHSPPLRLHPALTTRRETGRDFLLTSDAVFFRGDLDGDRDFELFRAPLDASSPPAPLSGSLVSGGSIGSSGEERILGLSPGGERIVYRADARIDGVTELFSVPSDGSAAPTRLSADLVPGGTVYEFRITPDGARVLYVADQDVANRRELYSVPIAGGAVTRVSAIPVPGGGLWFDSPQVDASGTHVVYTADALRDNQAELFSAPVDGSTPPVRLNPSLPTSGNVVGFRLSRDGTRVVFRADALVDDVFSAWVAPVDGSAAPVPLLGTALETAPLQSVLDVSASLALCLADPDRNGRADLYLARLDASQPALLLHATTGNISFAALAPDDGFALLLEAIPLDFRLLGVTFDGNPAVRLSPPMPQDRQVLQPRFRSDGALAFLCDAQARGQFSAWSHRGLAPLELTPDLPAAPASGDVTAYAWSPGSTHILYGADRFTEGEGCVTSVALRSGTETATPSRTGSIASLDFPPGRERFVYRQFAFDGVQALNTLYVGALDDAAQAPALFSETSIAEVLFPDEEHALIRSANAGSFNPPMARLTLARLDGSAAPRELAPPLGRPSGIGAALAPHAERAVYGVSDSIFVADSGLYGASLTTSSPRQRLDVPAHGASLVTGLIVRPSDELTLFVADLAAAGQFELWAVPADGSGAQRRLNAPLAPGYRISPEFRVSPSGAHVVFRTEASLAGPSELFVTRVADGQTLPLSGPLVAGGNILPATDGRANVWISPDGARVVYLADQAVDEVVEYWSVPLDASAPPVRLHAPLSGALDALPEPHFTPDGARVLFPLERTLDGTVELVIAPTDASAPPTVLSAPFPPGGGLKTSSGATTRGSLALAPGGRHAFYLAEQDVDGVVELYSVALDASAPPLRWNAPLVTGGNVVSFALRPTPGAVLYLADQDEDETFELWLASFPDAPPPRAGSGAPTGSAVTTVPN